MLHDDREKVQPSEEIDAHGGFALDMPAWLAEVARQLSELKQTGSLHETAPARVNLLRDGLERARHDPGVAPETLATVQHELAVAWQENLQADRNQSHETVIGLCEAALQTYTRARYPRQHAAIQNTLGRSYQRRMAGNRRENLERAIACHQQALAVFTLQEYAVEYALSSSYLGQIYWQRIEGERRENQEQSIACCREALSVFTLESFPDEYARTLHTLGAVYAQRIAGEQRENIEQAIACYREVLRVFTRADHPLEYAHSQSNLGLFYWQRIAGERLENLEQAVACYLAALEVCTLESLPYDYARIQMNLGAVYLARIAGKRRDNVEQAIVCYYRALQVWTLAAFPGQYAKVQNNLGEAYQHRLVGARAENIEQAIGCFDEALRFYAQDTSAHEYAIVQQNLGEAYQQRRVGNRQENLQRALACYDEALRFYTLDAIPREHRLLQLLRAEACAQLRDWSTAHSAYAAAMQAEDLLVVLGAGVTGRDAILKEGRDAAVRAGFALAHLGEIEAAAVTVERGRARGLAEAIEFNAADPAHISDDGRRARYTAARQVFITSQEALNAPLPTEQGEDAQRRVNLERTATYREAKVTFDAIVAEIRSTNDPADFLNAPLAAGTLLQASERCEAGHALVYLAATPWGGMALAVFSANPHLRTSSRFAALMLPELTDGVISDLIESHLDDAGDITGGFDCAQRGNALALLSRWHGVSLLEQAEMLHIACMAAKHTGSLDAAAQTVIALPELAHLIAQPLDTVSDEQRTLLASTLGHLVLQHELARCFPVLAEVALNRIVAWLREEGAGSLTLIPCGSLAAFPLLATPLAGGRTVDETLAASVAPSARSILRGGQSVGPRAGVYALGNPYPTQQTLRWGEAEALTLVALGNQLGQVGGVQVQWEATRAWLLEALQRGYVVDASCHGVFEAHDFLRSRLLLAMAEDLTLADLLSYQTDLRGLRLLILSACQTALLDLQGARDEVHSLAAGMLQAGAGAVLASLWSVDDKATYLLMVRFAQEWFPHMTRESPAPALTRARHWLRTVTNRELQAWQATLPQLPAYMDGAVSHQDESITSEAGDLLAVPGRGNRYDALQAQELVQIKAQEKDPQAVPYAEPYYWAGFQVTGW